MAHRWTRPRAPSPLGTGSGSGVSADQGGSSNSYRTDLVLEGGSAHTDHVVDELQREYVQVRDLLGLLKQRLVRLPVSQQWSGSMQRLARELSDQLEHAVAQAREPDEDQLRFNARPPRLR